MKNKKWIALLLCASILIGNVSAWAEEEALEEIEETEETEETKDFEESEDMNYMEKEEEASESEEEVKTEASEENIKADKDAVAADKKALDIGFTRCVSRDLRFPTEGKNGTQISWKSSKPEVISDEGKFTCPKQITELTVTATITKGDYREEKTFNITANNRTIYDVISDYVNTMVEYGRDTKLLPDDVYRNQSSAMPQVFDVTGKSVVQRGKSGLFWSMLNRDTLQPPTIYVDEWPRVYWEYEQRGQGCDVSADIFLYEMLYDFSLLTGDKKYEKIADEALSFFLEFGIHSQSGVLPWGDHLRYDPVIGAPNGTNTYDKSQEEWTNYSERDTGIAYLMFSPFWQQKFYELNPDAWRRHLLSWWMSTVTDQSAFTYSRHTPINGPGNASGNYASTWEAMVPAYIWGLHLTGDQSFKEALNEFMNYIERSSAWNKNYIFAHELIASTTRYRASWLTQVIVSVGGIYGLLPLVPDDIRERLERYIDIVINEFMEWDKSKGFAGYRSLRTGQATAYGSPVSGYWKIWAQLPEGELKDSLGSAIIEWTDKTAFGSLETKLSSVDLMANEFNNTFDLLLTVYSETGEDKYLDRILELADFMIYAFWDMESLLPSMSYTQKKYYESPTGTPCVASQMWNAYFLDIERKTGVNPLQQAWVDAGYPGKTASYLKENAEFLEKTRYDYVEEAATDEE